MDPLIAHDRAQQVLADVLRNVRGDQLAWPTPCTEWTVSELIDHVISGNDSVADYHSAAAHGDLAAACASSAERARAVFAAPDGMTRTHTLPLGTVPGAQYIKMRTTDLLLHAWDLARATGQSIDLDPELVAAVMPMARDLVQPVFRGPAGPFAPEQACPADRPPADHLAAFCGRSVS